MVNISTLLIKMLGCSLTFGDKMVYHSMANAWMLSIMQKVWGCNHQALSPLCINNSALRTRKISSQINHVSDRMKLKTVAIVFDVHNSSSMSQMVRHSMYTSPVWTLTLKPMSSPCTCYVYISLKQNFVYQWIQIVDY